METVLASRTDSQHPYRLPILLAAVVIIPFLAFHFRIPAEFCLFGCTLLGIALFHEKNLEIALGGLFLVVAYETVFLKTDLPSHVLHETPILLNLFGLLIACEILGRYVERSGLADILPKFLSDTWLGGFQLLGIVAFFSTFLDNIAAALIGAIIARLIYDGRVSVGFLAAIIAVSNAGGAPSALGDTTTMMMWMDKIPFTAFFKAAIGSIVVLAIVGVIASIQQHRYQPIRKDPPENVTIEWHYLAAAACIIGGIVVGNLAGGVPALGAWAVVIVAALLGVRIPAHAIPNAAKGGVFLCSLVLVASMMPVDSLPAPSWEIALILGYVSSVFDNIPLTKLALDQGGYDWGILAFTVGFGGSQTWFGSSAGVAVASQFPEIKNMKTWFAQSWPVLVSYPVAFFVMLALGKWTP